MHEEDLKTKFKKWMRKNLLCKIMAWLWMKKCGGSRMDTKKSYYNDQHQDPEVVRYRQKYIESIMELKKRMKVWHLLSEKEEEKYMKTREWFPMKDVMPIGGNAL